MLARAGLDTNSAGFPDTGYSIGYTDVRYIENNNFTAVRSYYYPKWETRRICSLGLDWIPEKSPGYRIFHRDIQMLNICRIIVTILLDRLASVSRESRTDVLARAGLDTNSAGLPDTGYSNGFKDMECIEDNSLSLLIVLAC